MVEKETPRLEQVRAEGSGMCIMLQAGDIVNRHNETSTQHVLNSLKKSRQFSTGLPKSLENSRKSRKVSNGFEKS